jgi:hypothetical protein
MFDHQGNHAPSAKATAHERLLEVRPVLGHVVYDPTPLDKVKRVGE